jgi:hypothetical protein
MSESGLDNLSPIDFELLVQDLLGAEWGARLEGFMVGRDGGVDIRLLRPAPDVKKTIVQCKHYARSGFSKLKSRLEDEAASLARHGEFRYVVATTVSMSPNRKSELLEALHKKGIPIEEQDILGREDIGTLIRRHPQVEQGHYKLWLNSSAVLLAALNNATIVRTRDTVSQISSHSATFVHNESVTLARKLLEKNHACLISGAPGVGKTTLASILLISAIAEGFKPVIISADIDEAFDSFVPDGKQIFFYDDFLGQTTSLDKMNKNEDDRLLRLLRLVRKSDNRFILTTREYILNQARMNYPRLDSPDLDLAKYVLRVGIYTHRVRAEILFNHLYFSALPESYLETFVKSKTYRSLVHHSNYNPRLIEDALNLATMSAVSSEDFSKYLLDTFENPTELWSHVFKRQFSILQRSALAFMVLEDPYKRINIEALHDAHEELRTGSNLEESFEDSLRVLEGTAVHIYRDQRTMAGATRVDFVNPGIADAVQDELLPDPAVFMNMLKTALTPRHLERLWGFALERPRNGQDGKDESVAPFASLGLTVLAGNDVPPTSSLRPALNRLIRVHAKDFVLSFVRVSEKCTLSHDKANGLMTALVLARRLGATSDEQVVTDLCNRLERLWGEGYGDKTLALKLFKVVLQDPIFTTSHRNGLGLSITWWFARGLEIASDYAQLEELRALPGGGTCDALLTRDQARNDFVERLEQMIESILESEEDTQTIESYLTEIEDVAGELEIDIDDLDDLDWQWQRDYVSEQAREREEAKQSEIYRSVSYEEDDHHYGQDGYTPSVSSRSTALAKGQDWMDDMFSSLLE